MNRMLYQLSYPAKRKMILDEKKRISKQFLYTKAQEIVYHKKVHENVT